MSRDGWRGTRGGFEWAVVAVPDRDDLLVRAWGPRGEHADVLVRAVDIAGSGGPDGFQRLVSLAIDRAGEQLLARVARARAFALPAGRHDRGWPR